MRHADDTFLEAGKMYTLRGITEWALRNSMIT